MKTQLPSLLLAAIFLLLFASCDQSNQEKTAHDGYVVSGTIANAARQKVYLDEMSFNMPAVADTATLDEKGRFTMKGKVSSPGLYRVRIDNNTSWTLILDNWNLELTADKNNISEYDIKGNEDNAAMLRFIKEMGDRQQALNIANNTYVTALTTGNPQGNLAEAKAEFERLQAEYQTGIKNFINQSAHPINKIFGASFLNLQEQYEYLKGVSADALKAAPQSKLVVEFAQRVQQIEAQMAFESKVQVGKPAPEIKLKNPKGEEIALSSLKGKVVLLDFWASWCRPCRVENPHVVKLYNRYKDKGFDIYSVSLDKQLNKWVEAIQQDGLAWKSHVSDLQGWQSSASAAYGVNSIPATFLLDKDGVIIARNLRGQQLEDKLKEVFN